VPTAARHQPARRRPSPTLKPALHDDDFLVRKALSDLKVRLRPILGKATPRVVARLGTAVAWRIIQHEDYGARVRLGQARRHAQILRIRSTFANFWKLIETSDPDVRAALSTRIGVLLQDVERLIGTAVDHLPPVPKHRPRDETRVILV
jgi:hypothetical protein